MTDRKFDLIVIGTGSGGSTAAGKCAKAGWEVAQIDSRPFGGTCARRGCDPKKVLVGAAELIDWNRRMKGNGITSNASINWQELMQFKRTFTEPVPKNREKGMQKIGITPIHGRASFVDDETIEVNGDKLKAQHFLIAAGAKPAPLPIAGFEYLTTSTEFLELDELPDKIIFVGGGYISFEFALIATIAGAEVHIVHRGKRPLEGNSRKAEYPAQPTVVFSLPPLASVGLTERQAREKEFDIEVKFKKTDRWYSYRRINESNTAFKTIINKKTGYILGAHIMGSKSEEIINLFAMAINQKVKTRDLKKMIYAYPSHASDIPHMV